METWRPGCSPKLMRTAPQIFMRSNLENITLGLLINWIWAVMIIQCHRYLSCVLILVIVCHLRISNIVTLIKWLYSCYTSCKLWEGKCQPKMMTNRTTNRIFLRITKFDTSTFRINIFLPNSMEKCMFYSCNDHRVQRATYFYAEKPCWLYMIPLLITSSDSYLP